MNEKIQNYKFKSGLRQEFEILKIKDLYMKCGEIMTISHRTDFYQILWFKKANLTHLVDFEPVKIGPETILFLNKSIVQKFDKHGNYEGYVLLFTEGFFCQTQEDVKFLRECILFNDFLSVPKIDVSKSVQPFEQMFDLLRKEFNSSNDNYQASVLRGLLRTLLLLSERERRSQDFKEVKKDINYDYVVSFKDDLENNFKIRKTVKEYAKQLHITPKKLNQATKVVLGKSPKQIIDERVILEAKRLIAHTNESIKEIGFTLGFDEPTNFIKFFKNHQQITPFEFRESNLE